MVIAISKKKAAREFAYITVSKENSALYHQYVDSVPTNQQTEPSANVAEVRGGRV
ncbi:hypothetical protein Q2941_51435 [Bradyrhizobium sp. UFLA05-153]